ncbi:MAG: hypothetical protein ACPGLV_07925 [Bacteroidia bacterium]
MGVVKKQGVANSIWMYFGLALGYINMGIIMAKFLSSENLGARQVIFQAGSFFSIIALVGLRNIINRFFPSFNNEENKHGGFVTFIMLYWLAGTLLSSVILLACKEYVMLFFGEKSNFLNNIYLFIIPFGASLALFNALTAYSTALLKSTVPIFIREVGQRVITSLLLILVVLKWISFEQFMNWYLLSYVLAMLVLVIYLIKMGQFHFSFKVEFKWLARLKEMFVFGLFTWFNNAMQILVKTADVFMLGAISGFSSAGIYGLGSLIGSIVQVPSQSLRQIGAPLISRYFEEDNMLEIGNLYKKTCMVQLVTGLFLYLLILVNLDVIFTIWRPEFASGKIVIVYLGAAQLIGGSTGMNGRIIVESKYFRWNFYFNLMLGVFAVLSNYLLIPQFGIKGAALASGGTIVTVSLLKVLFVYAKFNLQPFSAKTLVGIAIGLIAFFAVNYIPFTQIFVLDILIRSILFSIIFIPLIIRSNISPGVNELYFGFLKKLKILK